MFGKKKRKPGYYLVFKEENGNHWGEVYRYDGERWWYNAWGYEQEIKLDDRYEISWKVK